jgi:small subunit ribosomal protein S9
VAEAKTKSKFHRGTGRRKTAVARVRLSEGSGQIIINERPLTEYFTEERDRNAVTGPLDLTEMRGRLDLHASVEGGGRTGQAGAVSQGVARALKQMFGLDTEQPPAEDGQEATGGMAKKLRDSGYLTRDGRMKERKKYGRKGARKSFQFSKR